MKARVKPLLIAALLGGTALCALPADKGEEWGRVQGSQAIRVDNRVLAKPMGKPITVLDVMRRLDVHFHRAYPQYSRNLEARLHFYREGWRRVLDEMVDTELILADAEEKKVQVSDGEVRRELEDLFGPNVVENLDELNMSFDEAMQMVKADMITERMKGYMVSARAMAKLSPEKIRLAYDAFSKQQGESDEWEYQVLSIRHKSGEVAKEIAEKAASLVGSGGTLEEVKGALSAMQEGGELEGSAVITLSDLEKRSDKTLALSHREILSQLANGSYSPPQSQVSRVDGSTVMRLFYLKEHSVQVPPTFEEIQGQIKNHLLQMAALEEQERYIKRLRKQYGVTEESIELAGFEPFALQGYSRT
ncbi:MAG: hypothetical protein AB7W16_29535 [Candidatus Obscuribacterales bacterium]